MSINKKKVAIVLIIIVVCTVFFSLWSGMRREKKMVIEVEGFEIEYRETEMAINDFESIELGSSIYEISNKLGEPDEWIGSGMLRPVYFLKDKKVVVLHFKYPAVCEDLKQIILISNDGEKDIIK